MRTAVYTLLLAAGLVGPTAAFAQQPNSQTPGIRLNFARAQQTPNMPAGARQAQNDAERVVKRFGIGVTGGVGLDPEVVDFGAHATFAPLFRRDISFRPGVEFGLGEVTTLFGINLDVIYTLPGSTGGTRWAPYVGAGPNFALSHRGFSADDDDVSKLNNLNNLSDSNRFDFSDTDFSGGFNFIAGARSQTGVFFELNATAYGVSNVRLLAGFNF
jgi:hypothetical protein